MTAARTVRSSPLSAVLAVIAALALAVPAWVVTHAPVIRPAPKIVRLPKRIVPQAEIPEVEPVEFVDLAPDDARAYNASIPFSTDPNPAARPFRFTGGPDDLARATDCLATAVLYEAGDDTLGERAVAQVVLNRLRHPAFPKTVCGVVFEGQERSTGCQFSFTCDGALTRWHPTEASWRRAREVATMALAGTVFRPVGYATHYHTDWVVPYWQSSLDKVVAVHTHLFFRWTGWWGTPPAFNRQVSSSEPAIAQLAAISDAHRFGGAMAEADAALAEAAAVMGGTPAALPADPNTFLVTLPRGVAPETYPALALKACGDRPYCKYSAWADGTATPASLPFTPQQIAAMTFSYLRDRAGGYDKSLWNCQQVKRPDRAQCMKTQVYVTWDSLLANPPATAAPPVVPPRGPTDLGGVRRQPASAPSTTPTPRFTPAARPSPTAKPVVTPPGTSPAATP